MALGTNIFYYQEAPLTTLQGLEPFTDPLTWGHFVRDTTNNNDYWIEPGTGNLVLRGSGSGGSFNVSDGTTFSNIDSGDNLYFLDGDGTTVNVNTPTGTDTTFNYNIEGLATASQGNILTVGPTNNIVYESSNNIGGWRITPNGTDIRQLDSNPIVTFLGSNGVETAHVGTGSNSDRIVSISLDGFTSANNGQLLTVDTATNGLAYVNPVTIEANSTNYLNINANNELSVSNLAITKPFATAQTSIADFISTDPQYASVEEGDVVITTGGGTFIHNGGTTGTTADFFTVSSPGGGINSFSVNGNTGSLTVTDSYVLNVLGANGVITSIGANNLIVGLTAELSTLDSNSPGVDGQTYYVNYNNGVYNYVNINTLSPFDSFNITANSGTTGEITNGETLSIIGTANAIKTAVSNNQITIDLDGPIEDFASITPPVPIDDYYVNYNNGVYSYVPTSNLSGSDNSLSEANQSLLENRSILLNDNSLTVVNPNTGTVTTFSGNKVSLVGGDFETENSQHGLILTAPNNNKYRLQVNNIGAITSTLVV